MVGCFGCWGAADRREARGVVGPCPRPGPSRRGSCVCGRGRRAGRGCRGSSRAARSRACGGRVGSGGCASTVSWCTAVQSKATRCAAVGPRPRWVTLTTSTPLVITSSRVASPNRLRATRAGTTPTPAISHSSSPSVRPRTRASRSTRNSARKLGLGLADRRSGPLPMTAERSASLGSAAAGSAPSSQRRAIRSGERRPGPDGHRRWPYGRCRPARGGGGARGGYGDGSRSDRDRRLPWPRLACSRSSTRLPRPAASSSDCSAPGLAAAASAIVSACARESSPRRPAASVAGSWRSFLEVSRPARAAPRELPDVRARCSAAERSPSFAHARDCSTRSASNVLAAAAPRSIESYAAHIAGASDSGTSPGVSRASR